MTGQVRPITMTWAIFRKDLALSFRNPLFIFLTILSIVTFVTLYLVLPKDVNETITMGVRAADVRPALEQLAAEEEEGLALEWFDDSAELRAAVENRDLDIGVDFQDGFVTDVMAGRKTTVTVYVLPNLPQSITNAMTSMVREIAYALAGYQLPVSEPDEQMVVLGEDRAGDQVPFRDRLRPLYAFMILIMEAIALGALIAGEVQERTVTAILSTPARVGNIVIAKIVLGTLIAFGEAVIVMIIIRAFGSSPGIVLTALFLGAVMVTGVAMIAGSAGRDLMGTMLLGILFLLPLAIPGFSVLFPGTPALWVQYLPSYGIVHVILEATVMGAGWAESARYLLILAAWGVLFGLLGALLLKRKVETL